MSDSEAFRRFASTAGVRQDLKRNSVRAFGYILTSSGAEFVLRIASMAVLARLITPEHFGLFMMVTAITAIADQFRDLGLSTATIQRENINLREISNLFWINVAAGAALAIAVCALAPMVADYFDDARLTAITVALSANFLLGGLTVQHEALLTRQMKHGRKAVTRLVAFLLSTVLAVALAANGAGYWALVWREIARSVFIVAGVAIVCPWVPGLPDRHTSVRELVGFGKNLTLTYALGILSSALDRVLIGKAFGPAPVALYRQPYQLVVAPMSQFMSPLYQVALPGLSMLQNDPARYRGFYRRVVSMVAMISMPLSVFLAVYSHDLTLLILGPDWIGAAEFFMIFALGGILRSVASTAGFVLVSRGNSKTLLHAGILNTVVMIAFMSIGLLWGVRGVALGEVATVVVMLGPWMYLSFRGSPVSSTLFLSALLRPAASSALLAIVLLALRAAYPAPSAPAALAVGGIAAVVILVVAWLGLPGGRDEVKTIVTDVLAAARRKTGAPAIVPA